MENKEAIMLKYIKEILIIAIIIIFFAVLGIVTGIFGGKPGVFSQDLVAIAKGIPIMLGAIAALAVMAGVWKHPAGKVVIVLVVVAIIIIATFIL